MILAEGDNLVLKTGDQRVEAPCTPAIYHTLKAVVHIPLVLDVMLAPHAGEDPLEVAVLSEMREYRGLIAAAEATITDHGLDPEQVARQRKIIAACVQFLDTVVATQRCPRADLLAFTRRMTPWVMAKAAEAARSELEALHPQGSSWRSHITAEESARLSVVILGSAPPREENLTVQYFARLLGEPGEGRRITFAESIREEPKALDLMATRTVDTAIGVDFFNDPLRMHRDLLADAAKEYLPLLIDRPQCACHDPPKLQAAAATGSILLVPAGRPAQWRGSGHYDALPVYWSWGWSDGSPHAPASRIRASDPVPSGAWSAGASAGIRPRGGIASRDVT